MLSIKDFNKEYINKYKKKIVVIKYGGNAMLNDELKRSVMQDIASLHDFGVYPVVVHGGGPFIKELLNKVGVHSEFIDGQRKTTEEALVYIEMALKGQVNGDLVRIINSFNKKAVGLSGKDGMFAIAEKRNHIREVEGRKEEVDLLQVGDVTEVSTELLRLLLENGYIPVIATIASGRDHKDYNVNADLFAGVLAGALQAEAYIALTDVDGVMKDPNDKSTLISEITCQELTDMKDNATIKGGMLPKMDSCVIAIQKGVKTIRIINGTSKHSMLYELFTDKGCGTLIKA